MPVDLFVDNSEEIDVKIFVAPSKSRKYIYADIDVAKLKETGKDDIDEANIEEHHVFFRSPSYGDTNKILDAAVSMRADNSVEISPSEMRLERIATLILRWTFKGKDGKPTKPTRENIRSLHNVVASIIALDLEFQLQERGLL